MHKVETILFGIALIIFGIASIMIVEYTEWQVFELFGVVSPVLGIVVSLVGLFYEGKGEKDN